MQDLFCSTSVLASDSFALHREVNFLVAQVAASVRKPLPVVTVEGATLPEKITQPGNNVVTIFPILHFVSLFLCTFEALIFL